MIGPGNGAGKVEAMKLSENSARFAVVYNAFHGGGVTSYHASLSAAEAAQWRSFCGSQGLAPAPKLAPDFSQDFQPFFSRFLRKPRQAPKRGDRQGFIVAA